MHSTADSGSFNRNLRARLQQLLRENQRLLKAGTLVAIATELRRTPAEVAATIEAEGWARLETLGELAIRSPFSARAPDADQYRGYVILAQVLAPEPEATPPHGDAGCTPPLLLSAADLAERFGVTRAQANARLQRWRRSRPGSDGWIETQDRKPREPQFLYRLLAVEHLFDSRVSSDTRTTHEKKSRGV